MPFRILHRGERSTGLRLGANAESGTAPMVAPRPARALAGG